MAVKTKKGRQASSAKIKQSFLSRPSIGLASFCLVFACIGGYLITSSHADGTDYGCAPNNYSVGSTGVCVKVIQEIINQVHASTLPAPGLYHLNVDGNYGQLTAADVKILQKDSQFPSYQQDGKVGPFTWENALCRDVSWTGPLWLDIQGNCHRYDD